MKKAFIAAASMMGIIAVRMILSVTFGEQTAEVFTRVSGSFLFFYCCFQSAKNRQNAKKHCTVSSEL